MMHLIKRIACVISAVAALCIGLSAFGFNVMEFLPKTADAVKIMKYVVGAAGLISLVMMVVHRHHDCHCGDKK